MQNLKKSAACVVLLSFIAVGGTTILPTPAQGEDIKPVRVVNTPLEVNGAVNASVTGTVDANVTGNVNAAVTGNVGIIGTPDVRAQQSGTWNVGISGNSAANPLFVQGTAAQPTLVSDGRAFVLPPDPNIAFEFAVPANVVLTDVQLSLRSPALSATVFVSDGGTQKIYVFQSVGSQNSTWAGSNAGQAAFHFQSGIRSASGFRVGLYCSNIGGNACNGALMWSGFEQ